jgi:type IV secretory pathway VirB9-like protein
MSPRLGVLIGSIGLIATVFSPAVVTGQATGIREISASPRSLMPLQTRLRYSTMIVLPDDEEILDVICGDRDFWVISATHNIAHVKPAKEGAATNLNLVTASGAIYSFLLTEKNGAGTPDVKVYVSADPDVSSTGKLRYYSASQIEELRAELSEARVAVDAANRRSTDAIAAYQQEYPARLQFVYGQPRYVKPFRVRSMWHDGQFTYIKTDASELPALYEIKNGKPSLVNFQVRLGTYVVPKVLEEGYLMLGKQRFAFAQQAR